MLADLTVAALAHPPIRSRRISKKLLRKYAASALSLTTSASTGSLSFLGSRIARREEAWLALARRKPRRTCLASRGSCFRKLSAQRATPSQATAVAVESDWRAGCSAGAKQPFPSRVYPQFQQLRDGPRHRPQVYCRGLLGPRLGTVLGTVGPIQPSHSFGIVKILRNFVAVRWLSGLKRRFAKPL